MSPLTQRIVSNGLIAGASLGGLIAGGVYVLQRGMSAQGIEPAAGNAPLWAGLLFAGIAFAIVAVIECLAFAWRKLRGKRHPWDPIPEPKEPM